MKTFIQTTLISCFALTALSVAAQDDAALLKKAKKIHEKAFTVDTHADTPMLLLRWI
ncbi:hypothetical protein [Runella sp.]|jgi:membrane dipeptidase|uniref:hypothetical protein n=1 Tax=Runella sp. TaxID=1960881 RepID=UPI00262A7A57|nr:hypothetical protein [Runella sp.]